MESPTYYLIAYPIVFIILSVLWVVVLLLYNLIFEAFDFGPLVWFVGKSALLLSIMTVIYLLPYVHWFSLIAWWIGLMIVFKKDFWECRILVFLIFAVGILVRFAVVALLVGALR